MKNDEAKPFIDHLEELRGRLGIVLVTAGLLSVGCYFFVDSIIGFLSRPAGSLVFLRPTEAFFVRLKIALISGGLLSIPILIYEVWRFVGVALTSSERKATLGILPVSYALFCAGAALAWFVVLPLAIRFLLGFSTEELRPMLSIDAYVGFAVWFTVAFGMTFQLPVVIFFLVSIGIVSPQNLSYYRRHVVLGLAILAALLTPGPDFISQLALLIPTYLLYEISIWIARWTYRENPNRAMESPRNVENISL